MYGPQQAGKPTYDQLIKLRKGHGFTECKIRAHSVPIYPRRPWYVRPEVWSRTEDRLVRSHAPGSLKVGIGMRWVWRYFTRRVLYSIILYRGIIYIIIPLGIQHSCCALLSILHGGVGGGAVLLCYYALF
jgi:hypothetical protein